LEGDLFFMPNKLMAWNAISGQGNPTRSIEVNKLVKAVQEGSPKTRAPSMTRRSMMIDEFKATIHL
jgi:hypothetical protein